MIRTCLCRVGTCEGRGGGGPAGGGGGGGVGWQNGIMVLSAGLSYASAEFKLV